MNYTERQKAEFRARFVQMQRYQAAMYVPLVGAVVLLVLSVRYLPDLAGDSGTIALGTAGLVGAAVVFSWLNWRCPACAKWLGTSLSPDCCPRCGIAFRR